MNSNHITSNGIAFLFNINSKSVSIFYNHFRNRLEVTNFPFFRV